MATLERLISAAAGIALRACILALAALLAVASAEAEDIGLVNAATWQAAVEAARRPEVTTIALAPGVLECEKTLVIADRAAALRIIGAGIGITTLRIPRDVSECIFIGGGTTGVLIEQITFQGEVRSNADADRPAHPASCLTRVSRAIVTTRLHCSADPRSRLDYESGEYIRDIHIRNVEISNVTTAIEIAGCVVGICGGHREDRFRIPGVRIESNLIYQIYGTKSGSGYGIHISNVPGAVVAQNVVAYAQRHSIYVSFGNFGTTTPVRLHGNIVLVGAFPGAQWYFACTAIARSAHVLVTAHIDFGCRATALSIERAEEFRDFVVPDDIAVVASEFHRSLHTSNPEARDIWIKIDATREPRLVTPPVIEANRRYEIYSRGGSAAPAEVRATDVDRAAMDGAQGLLPRDGADFIRATETMLVWVEGDTVVAAPLIGSTSNAPGSIRRLTPQS